MSYAKVPRLLTQLHEELLLGATPHVRVRRASGAACLSARQLQGQAAQPLLDGALQHDALAEGNAEGALGREVRQVDALALQCSAGSAPSDILSMHACMPSPGWCLRARKEHAVLMRPLWSHCNPYTPGEH